MARPDPAFLLHRGAYRLSQAAARRRLRVEARRDYPRLRAKFWQNHGYPLNLAAPATFSERLQLRKVRDRDPRFPTLVDKWLVRDHIDDVLGPGSADGLMVPALVVADRFSDLPQSLWSRDVMLKGTHGSGMNIAVPAHDTTARRTARWKFLQWLGQVHGANGLEWAYQSLDPRIIAEPFLNEGEMIDLRVFVYDGTPRFVRVQNLSAKPTQGRIYRPDWSASGIHVMKYERREFPRPAEMDRFLDLASALGTDFDMLRVDFLLTEQRFYLGELTVYVSSGMKRFETYEQDRAFAEGWNQRHLGVDA